MKLYRLMKPDGGTPPRPLRGDRFGELGARPPGRGTTVDVPVDTAGMVHPGDEGLSTFDRPNRPKRNYQDWVIESDLIGGGLAVVASPDTPGRYHIVPARPMPFAEYQYLLGETQDVWEPVM